jgi:S1-C subfamily serine protease
VFDAVLVVLLILAAVIGYQQGLVRSLAALLGMIVGGVIAFAVVPSLVVSVQNSPVSILMIPMAILLSLLLGRLLGSFVGRLLHRGAVTAKIGLFDRMIGAAAHVVVFAVVIAVVSASLTTLGNSQLTIAVTNSRVVAAVNGFLPTKVRQQIAAWQSALTESGLPRVLDAIGGLTTNPELPQDQAATAAQQNAAASVVRISGVASACNDVQTGSGFVVSRNRVVTNAHVVAGVTDPVVESRSGQSARGRVVSFDPARDLAVIAVESLNVPSLELAAAATPGETAAVQGYPFGGPFVSRAATVLNASTVSVADIYGAGQYQRHIYTLAADVQPGNSGGPLLDGTGDVLGVVFAKDKTLGNVGYALTDQELAAVASAAPTEMATVSTQSCRTAG